MPKVTHGATFRGKITREFRIWAAAKQRCFNPKNTNYHNYGGRGIIMYEGWHHDFKAFLDYIGPCPSSQHSLDRYPNNNGNYEPGNVRWVTHVQQHTNKRVTRFITYNGETLCIAHWSRKTGIAVMTIHHRFKHGWPVDKIFTQERWIHRSRNFQGASSSD